MGVAVLAVLPERGLCGRQANHSGTMTGQGDNYRYLEVENQRADGTRFVVTQDVEEGEFTVNRNDKPDPLAVFGYPVQKYDDTDEKLAKARAIEYMNGYIARINEDN